MHLLIPSAGSGSRMGAGINKLLLPIAGKPILSWTLDAVFQADSIKWIGIIGQPTDRALIMDLVKDSLKPLVWIDGGKTRQESVQLGLNSLPSDAKHVLIHDGARCLVEPNLFNQCAEKVKKGIAIIAATPVVDTIKKVNADGFIENTPERSTLWAAQTPQGFPVDELRKAHTEAFANGWIVTDDASLYERLGWDVRILESKPSNLKVTSKFDLAVAEALISSRER